MIRCATVMRWMCIAVVAVVLSSCTASVSTSAIPPSGAASNEPPSAAVRSVAPPSASASASDASTVCDCPCPSSPVASYPGVGIAKVALQGGEFFTRVTDEPDIRRGKGLDAAPESVVDGMFLDRFQQWDEGAVWWEQGLGAGSVPPWLQIDLDGVFTIDAAIVQADNNDTYLLSFRDATTGAWTPLWTVPPDYSFGMVTRPNQYDDTERHPFTERVTTDALRFEATEGDGMYAVSEVQVFGVRTQD